MNKMSGIIIKYIIVCFVFLLLLCGCIAILCTTSTIDERLSVQPIKVPASIEPVRITVPAVNIDPRFPASQLYARSGEVSLVDRFADVIEFYDTTGQHWTFQGAEDWQQGDTLCAVFCSLGTFDRCDDVIVNVTYEARDY